MKTEHYLITKEDFKSPLEKYRLHPMEHELSEDNTNIKPFLVDSGAGGGVINSPWKEGWNHNVENLEKLIDTAKKMKEEGLRVWLYDDVWYPSGWAGGYVVNTGNSGGKHLGQTIGFYLHEGEKKQELNLTLPSNGIRFIYAAAYTKNKNGQWDYSKPIPVKTDYFNVIADCPNENWQLLTFYVRWGNSWPYSWCDTISWPNGPRGLLNFLNKDAVACFIEGSLQLVADASPVLLGDLFDAVFTDEPALNAFYLLGPLNKPSFETVPYGDELFDRFEEMHGYNLTNMLPYLFFDDGIQAATVRIHYYRTISDLLKRNFTGQVGGWCRSNGTKYSGHLLSEEKPSQHVAYYGDYMEVISEMDWPGYDICEALHKNYWQPDARGALYMNGKYASSVARGKGSNDTMIEMCPEGHQKEMLKSADNILDEFMSMTTNALFAGATHIHVYAYRFIHDNNHFNKWNEYTGRLCSILRESSSAAQIGVYYPIADAQAFMYSPNTAMDDLSDNSKRVENYLDNLVYTLYQNQFDFNILTENMILDAFVKDSFLHVHDTAYKVLLFPRITVLPLAVVKKLEKFTQLGGTVYFLEQLPYMGLYMEEHEAVREAVLRISGGKPISFRPDNLAMGAHVTASSTMEDYNCDVLTNGSAETWFSWDCWRSQKLPATLTFELNKKESFNKIVLYSKEEYEQKQFVIDALVDDKWKQIVSEDENTKSFCSYEFPLITTQRIRITLENGCEKQPEIAGLTEIQLFRTYYDSKESEWLSNLRSIVPSTIKTKGNNPGSILVSKYMQEGKEFYFLINKGLEVEKFKVCHTSNHILKIYEPESGNIFTMDEKPINLAPGRGILVQPI